MEKRIIPVNLYDTVTMEQWLSQMAEEGLMLDSFSGKKAVFQDEYCQKIKYRLIPIEDEEEKPSSEMKELFEESGWKYVATLEKVFYIFSNDAEYPKPVPFAKEEERRIYEDIKKKKRNNMILSTLAFVFLGGLQLWLFYLKLDDYIVGRDVDTSYVYFLAMVLNVMAAIREYRAYVLINRKLESIELGQETDSPYIPTTKWVRAETLVNILVFVMMLFPIFSAFYEDNFAVEISEDALPFTYVSLQEIETAERNGEYNKEYTYIDTNTSFLVPVHYEIKEDGKTIYDFNGEQEKEKVHLEMSYIELRYEALANKALQGMMEHYDTAPMEQKNVDQAWIEQESGETNIFLLKENKVLGIRYEGEADILSHLDDYSDMLQ